MKSLLTRENFEVNMMIIPLILKNLNVSRNVLAFEVDLDIEKL